MASNRKSFVTQKEETDYWCGEANKYKKSYEALLDELNEYQASSHELEAELETQLNQSETRLRDLKVFCSKLQSETDDIKERYEKLQQSSYLQISDIENKLKTLENYKETSRKYIRQLEQTNDDLERANRAAMASLEDYEYKLNQAIEHNVFLETDLEEKESMYFANIQHLMEEIKDLKHEIDILKRSEKEVIDEKMTEQSEEIKTPSCSSNVQQRRKVRGQSVLESRQCTAMAIISEMIKQIGSMEKKLSPFQMSDLMES